MAASLELAISAIRAGRKDEGRQLLNLLIQQNPNNEQAWLWMSSVVDTDEKRARCLYHVLAINPNNQLARKGLNILGIVLTDSRPIRVPTDSQPIAIPKPTHQTSPLLPHEAPPAAQPASAPVAPPAERRPFRIDPATITKDLPFTPVTQSANGNNPQPAAETPAQTPSEPVAPVSQPPAEEIPLPNFPEPAPVPPPAVHPDAQSVTRLPGNPSSEPVQPVQPPPAPRPDSQPVYPQPYVPGGGHETRPTQPFPASSPPMPPPTGQMYNPQHPSEPVYVGHSNATMGMPVSYQPNQPQPQYYPQPYAMMAMQNPTMHSGATMAMPPGYMPVPAANTDYRAMAAARKKPRPVETEEDNEEGEVNILAVIVFGSLSVTALGGLGMLILLMFTSGV